MALYGKDGEFYATSDDGLAWSDPVQVFASEPDAQTPYPFFAGLEGASDDCGTVGREFYLYFPDRVNFKVYRVPFRVT